MEHELPLTIVMGYAMHFYIHQTLPQHYFLLVFAPSQENERSGICVLGIAILLLSVIIRFDFEIVPTVSLTLEFW